MAKRLLIIVFLLISLGSIAQEQHPYIKNLKARAFEGKLIVSWTTKAGFSCQDIVVQLSEDSIQFENKATYFGICGDTSEKDYVLTVEEPFLNSKNYIKLDLGFFGDSYVICETVLNVQTARIIPMPLTTESKLHFKNPLRDHLQIDIYSFSSKQIASVTTDLSELELHPYLEENGIYYYVIRKKETVLYRGKFVKIN